MTTATATRQATAPAALLVDQYAPHAPAVQALDVPLALIVSDPANERTAAELAPAHPEFAALVESLATVGLRERVQLYPLGNGQYTPESGHRRIAAARLLAWPTIPALVIPPPADGVDTAINRLAANCHAAINAMRMAHNIAALRTANPALTQEALGRAVGLAQSSIANAERLLALPLPVQMLVEEGQISAAHGVTLLAINAAEVHYWTGQPTGQSAAQVQQRLAQEAAAQGSSVKMLRQNIALWQQNQEQGHRAAPRYEQEQAHKAAEQARQSAVAAQARAAGQNPQAAVQADERARQAAAWQAREAESERLAAQRAARAALAHTTLAGLLGQDEGAPPSLEGWRLLTYLAVGRAHNMPSYQVREALLQRVDAARTIPTLHLILGEIVAHALALTDDNRAISRFETMDIWADRRWFLNAAIAEALFAAKLIPKVTRTRLLKEGAARPKLPGASA